MKEPPDPMRDRTRRARVLRLADSTPVETFALLAAALAVTEAFRSALTTANVALIYLTAVVVVGIRRGVRAAVVASAASVIAMSFFNAVPRFSLRAERPEDWVTLLCFGVAAVVTGNLAGRFRRQLEETQRVAARNERLYGTSEALAGASTSDEAVEVIRREMGAAFGGETLLLLAGPDGALQPAHATSARLGDADRVAARTAYRERRWTGRGIPGSTESEWSFVPLEGDRRAVGVLGLRRVGARPLGPDNARLLVALCHLAAVALDRHRLADEMRAAQMSAESEKLRAALLSSVSHDLRTPLASIIGAASTLDALHAALPLADQRELIATVLAEAERLNRFVANLLDMTRLGYGRLEPRPAWCDLRDLIAEATHGLHGVLAGRTLRVEIPDDFPLLHVDAVLLERVLANLVDNAAKYSPADEALLLRARVDGDEAVVQMLDRGPGIPADQREAVFQPFHRVRDGDKRAAGTGLGLTICRGLAEALGGSIALRDGEGGVGLCAEVRLPLHSLEAKRAVE